MRKKIIIGTFLIITLFVALWVYARFDPSKYAIFPKCPVYTYTGYKCPGCGSQRAIYNLINGHFLTAFRYNALLFVIIPYIFIGIFIEYIADQNKIYVARMRSRLFSLGAFLFLIVLIAVFTIIRNIYHF